MDQSLDIAALVVIAFAAFLVKAMSGFGPALIVVSLGSLLFPPQAVIALSALLDTTAGVILTLLDPALDGRRFWIPASIAIVLGSIVGGLLMSLVSPDDFRSLLAVAILVLGAWFFLYRTRNGGAALADAVPAKATPADLGMSAAGGVMGGFLGISGPPILWHLGRRMGKRPLRQVLIPIFLAAALARVGTYAATGVLTGSVLMLYLYALPGLIAGTYVGNRIFLHLSEVAFSRVIGILLLAVGIWLLTS